jgi:molybdopterin/thiamine biosynthesis adenylyltransferase
VEGHQLIAEESRLFAAGADVLAISEATVLVAVDGIPGCAPWEHPAWALCRALRALGFGRVELHGGEEHSFEFSHLMHGAVFEHTALEWLRELASARSQGQEVIVHLGSDPLSREFWVETARRRASNFIGVQWGSSWIEMGPPCLDAIPAEVFPLEAVGDESPIPPLARISAGLALQETLNVVGQLDEAAPPETRVSFDAASETRAFDGVPGEWTAVPIENEIVEVIGAGAVGTNFLESFAPLLGRGCELRIFDFDQVGPENLSIQPAFSSHDVGRPKAEVMAEKLAKICNTSLEPQPSIARYEERPRDLSTPTLRVCCPDTFAARKYCNDRSLADGVPLVEAGCSPLAAQVRSYLPGYTACLEHRIRNLPLRAAQEQDRAACAQQQAFTLPGTTMICGGLLATEALRALDPDHFGRPLRGTLTYDARFGRRFGILDERPACSHERKERSGARERPAGGVELQGVRHER